MQGKVVAGLVLSIVAIALGCFVRGWFAVIALPVAIVGLVLSISGGKDLKAAGQPAGIATAGLAVGIVAVVLTAVFFFTCGLCTITGKVVENAAEGAAEKFLSSL